MEEGDSGSIVFVEIKGEKHALGLLQGRRMLQNKEGDHDIYEAIILCHALKDVEAEYPQLVGAFTHCGFRGGPKPPCT